MRKRGAGLLLVLTLIVAVGTLVQDFRFDRSIARERAGGLALDRELGGLVESLANMRAAQAGYVAAGQGPEVWMKRVSDLSAAIDDALARRREATFSTEARARYQAAATALADLRAIDARARASVGQNDRLFASDLVFMDARGLNDKLASELTGARSAELATTEGRMARLGNLRLAINAVALGFAVVVAWFFGRSVPAAEPKPAPSTLQMLRDLPPPVKNTSSPAPAQTSATAATLAARTVNLTAAAELCVDLARVIDGRDVPALVERAASVLEAKGVVLWVADASGALLRPSLIHGYSEKVIAKLGSLQIDADNVTSLAFRSMRPQAIQGSTPGMSGAIAVPLVTASGCVGVLAAETRQYKPGIDVLPIASIIAAQLAALVVTGDGSEHRAQA